MHLVWNALLSQRTACRAGMRPLAERSSGAAPAALLAALLVAAGCLLVPWRLPFSAPTARFGEAVVAAGAFPGDDASAGAGAAVGSTKPASGRSFKLAAVLKNSGRGGLHPSSR